MNWMLRPASRRHGTLGRWHWRWHSQSVGDESTAITEPGLPRPLLRSGARPAPATRFPDLKRSRGLEFDRRVTPVKFAAVTTAILICVSSAAAAYAQVPAPPAGIDARDRPWDAGTGIDVTIRLSPDNLSPQQRKTRAQSGQPLPPDIEYYRLEQSGEANGVFVDVANVVPTERDFERGNIEYQFDLPESERGEPFYFRARAVTHNGKESSVVQTTEAARASRQWFDGSRFWLLVITLVICGSVVVFIVQARSGKDLKMRQIAGLEAVEEAVGRATEMGRSCLFVPGIQDMNEIQTIAGITILSRVARAAANTTAGSKFPPPNRW